MTRTTCPPKRPDAISSTVHHEKAAPPSCRAPTQMIPEIGQTALRSLCLPRPGLARARGCSPRRWLVDGRGATRRARQFVFVAIAFGCPPSLLSRTISRRLLAPLNSAAPRRLPRHWRMGGPKARSCLDADNSAYGTLGVTSQPPPSRHNGARVWRDGIVRHRVLLFTLFKSNPFCASSRACRRRD